MTVGYAVLGSLNYAEYRSHQQATRYHRNGIKKCHLQLIGYSYPLQQHSFFEDTACLRIGLGQIQFDGMAEPSEFFLNRVRISSSLLGSGQVYQPCTNICGTCRTANASPPKTFSYNYPKWGNGMSMLI